MSGVNKFYMGAHPREAGVWVYRFRAEDIIDSSKPLVMLLAQADATGMKAFNVNSAGQISDQEPRNMVIRRDTKGYAIEFYNVEGQPAVMHGPSAMRQFNIPHDKMAHVSGLPSDDPYFKPRLEHDSPTPAISILPRGDVRVEPGRPAAAAVPPSDEVVFGADGRVIFAEDAPVAAPTPAARAGRLAPPVLLGAPAGARVPPPARPAAAARAARPAPAAAAPAEPIRFRQSGSDPNKFAIAVEDAEKFKNYMRGKGYEVPTHFKLVSDKDEKSGKYFVYVEPGDDVAKDWLKKFMLKPHSGIEKVEKIRVSDTAYATAARARRR